jgi:glycosyltransferase involved in cell wall biosynthesis
LESVRATVISSSRYTARSLGYTKVHVIYNGVADCARPRASAASAFRIGVIGRIAPQKGQIEFVRAARLLAKAACAYRFEVCGAASPSDPVSIRYEQEVRRAAQGLPVQFTGWMDDVPSVLARLDVLVVPSIAAEATTRVIPEAFSAGVAVIAFRMGGIPEVVSHGRTGVLVDEIRPEALAHAIDDLASSDPAEVREMARATGND